MKTLSCLDEVTQILDQHENSLRIKKLIFCACKNAWENDPNKLNNFQISELIKELIELNPTINSLKITLSKVVKSLNKQAEYSILASLVFSQLQKIYIYKDSENLTPTASASSSGCSNSTPSTNTQPSSSKQAEPLGLTLPPEYNSFEIRQEIIKYTNPLRAKLLIFSTLYGNFSFSERDWSVLRKYQLDNLLEMLLLACQSLQDFEDKLNMTAKNFQNPHKNSQAVSAIMQAIRLYYPSVESQVNQISVANSNTMNSTDEDDNDLNTCQLFEPKDIFKR